MDTSEESQKREERRGEERNNREEVRLRKSCDADLPRGKLLCRGLSGCTQAMLCSRCVLLIFLSLRHVSLLQRDDWRSESQSSV